MTVETLLTQIQNGLTPKWLHFWGHTPAKDGSLGLIKVTQRFGDFSKQQNS